MMGYPPGYKNYLEYIIDGLAEQNGLWPLRAGHHVVSPEHLFPPKLIAYYALHFVMKGKLIYSINGQQHTMRKGDVFCVYPEVIYRHIYAHSKDEPLEIIWVSINGPTVPRLLAMAQFSPDLPYVRDILNLELETLLRSLFDKPYNESNTSKVALYAAIYRMFALIIPEEGKSASKNGPDYWIPLSVDYMNTHFTDSINVQDVARYISIHRVYFAKMFTQRIGMTPQQYLQKLRMERAIHLLAHTTRSITEIALSLGYLDLYAFTRAFTNYYGTSPSAYKAKKPPIGDL